MKITLEDKSYDQKRLAYRQIVRSTEIKNAVDTVTDEVFALLEVENVGVSHHTGFKDWYKDFAFKYEWHDIKQFLIDGYLAKEIIWDTKQENIIGLLSLDPIDLMPYNLDGQDIWKQDPGENHVRFLNKGQVLYCAWDSKNTGHQSYVASLHRPFTLYSLVNSYAVIGNGPFESPDAEYLFNNFKRATRVPNRFWSFDPTSKPQDENELRNEIKFAKFTRRIAKVFKIGRAHV